MYVCVSVCTQEKSDLWAVVEEYLTEDFHSESLDRKGIHLTLTKGKTRILQFLMGTRQISVCCKKTASSGS